MMRRMIFDVLPCEGNWAVTRRGSDQPIGMVRTKADAVARARELAKRYELAQVVVHALDGTVQSEHMYGTDPRRVKG